MRKPLPAGPVELVPEDSLAIGGLMLLSLTQPGGGSIELLNAFLFSHLRRIWSATFWRTRSRASAIARALFLGFVPRLWDEPWIDLAVLTASTSSCMKGSGGRWLVSPGPRKGSWTINTPELRIEEGVRPILRLALRPFPSRCEMARGIGRGDAILISMLAGWWFFALGAWIPTQWLSTFLFSLGHSAV